MSKTTLGNPPRPRRQGFLRIKLTNEAVMYEIANYERLTGTDSARAKAAAGAFFFSLLAIAQDGGETLSYLLAYGVVWVVAAYRWPLHSFFFFGFIIIAMGFLRLVEEPYAFVGLLIAFYLYLFLFYPAYQVERTRRSRKL